MLRRAYERTRTADLLITDVMVTTCLWKVLLADLRSYPRYCKHRSQADPQCSLYVLHHALPRSYHYRTGTREYPSVEPILQNGDKSTIDHNWPCRVRSGSLWVGARSS